MEKVNVMKDEELLALCDFIDTSILKNLSGWKKGSRDHELKESFAAYCNHTEQTKLALEVEAQMIKANPEQIKFLERCRFLTDAIVDITDIEEVDINVGNFGYTKDGRLVLIDF